MKEFDPQYSKQLSEIAMAAMEENWHSIHLVAMLYEKLTHWEAWRFYDGRAPAILEWCDQNANDKWCEYAGMFYFKDEGDAAMFLLRWS